MLGDPRPILLLKKNLLIQKIELLSLQLKALEQLKNASDELIDVKDETYREAVLDERDSITAPKDSEEARLRSKRQAIVNQKEKELREPQMIALFCEGEIPELQQQIDRTQKQVNQIQEDYVALSKKMQRYATALLAATEYKPAESDPKLYKRGRLKTNQLLLLSRYRDAVNRIMAKYGLIIDSTTGEPLSTSSEISSPESSVEHPKRPREPENRAAKRIR